MTTGRLLSLFTLGALALGGAVLLIATVLHPAHGQTGSKKKGDELTQPVLPVAPRRAQPPGLDRVLETPLIEAHAARAAYMSGAAAGPAAASWIAPRVEYPEFLGPGLPPPDLQQDFNPSAHVESRVARLYYFRDAHRVAQVINRMVRPYNYAAKTLAERDAEGARFFADEWTQERRAVEFQAMRSAQDLREAQRELDATQDELQELAESDGDDPQDDARREALEETQEALQRTVGDLRQDVRELEARTIDAQAHEDRAREEQFRMEVAAAHTDPDTYAPGKRRSHDPVAQVSISVIGEGVIQLRGPIKGINKIRHMINQMDSPVGQIKIGIETVQVNGEKGDRMERVIGRIEGNIDLGRYLTNQSLLMLRRAIQMEAARVAESVDHGGHFQMDRDRKYLYEFFGRDFIDELYAMDSEFLHTENKILSIHSMDTISLNRALFVLALAKNDVRQQILINFLNMARQELPQAEYDFRKAACLYPFKLHGWMKPFIDQDKLDARLQEYVYENAFHRYHFRNLVGHFDSGVWQTDTLNPMQREFLRLAQIFKSQMIAEVELKQRVIERGLIQAENEQSLAQLDAQRDSLRERVLEERDKAYQQQFTLGQELVRLSASVRAATKSTEIRSLELQATRERVEIPLMPPALAQVLDERFFQLMVLDAHLLPVIERTLESMSESPLRREQREEVAAAMNTVAVLKTRMPAPDAVELLQPADVDEEQIQRNSTAMNQLALFTMDMVELIKKNSDELNQALEDLRNLLTADQFDEAKRDAVAARIAFIRLHLPLDPGDGSPDSLYALMTTFLDKAASLLQELISLQYLERTLTKTRAPLDHKRLLDHLIDEHEEKYIELLEGTRAHIAAVDNYLKRLAIAIEDDLKVQFYDPAFVQIRGAARAWDVTLGQVERTTILTNNRAFAKVTPQATMEFDLPKRKIAIVEAMEGARALAEDYGALLEDPTFLAAFQMMGGGQRATVERSQLSGLPSETDETQLRHSTSPDEPADSALQALVPDPEIYKFETGTGFEIRPVIQPDGDSVVYDFHYMYTTHVREPVDPDEKHLGRVKRHFVDTQVQTSSFELREISRYQVALKAARTSRGVPLLEDIPLVGVLFRPAPSAESSIQQNIILGRSVVYPTLFDLMGLRWAPHVADLNHLAVKDAAHVVRGRNQTVADYVFERASARVDEFLNVEYRNPAHYRPDLYHRQRRPSPYHPGGYLYDKGRAKYEPIYDERGQTGVDDPTGQDFRIPDRRPIELRQPPYDDRFGVPVPDEEIELEPILAPPAFEPQSRYLPSPSGSAVRPVSHAEPPYGTPRAIPATGPRPGPPSWRRLPPTARRIPEPSVR